MGTPGTALKVFKWWLAEDETAMARELYATLSFLDKEQRPRKERNMQCLRMYGNLDYVGMGPFSYTRTNSAALPENRVKLNIIASMVDTVAAKISKMKPKVTFLTAGGDFSVQEKARKLQKFVQGLFYENHVHRKHQGMFRDSLIFDIGALKHFVSGKKIHTERVLPTELYVDTADAMYGHPSHMYHVKVVAKDALIADYPEHAAAIQASAGFLEESQHVVNQDSIADFCVVIEGWHLDTGDGDGLHVIATDKVVLHKKRYRKDYFPFTFDRWCDPLVGFYGQSLADRLVGNQMEINKMLRCIQRAFHLGSSFKVFLEYGSKVAKEHINNDIGSIVYYSGQQPNYYTPQTVHPEYFRHLEWLVKSSYEEAGVSQLSAQSKLPAGLDGGSGKALREYNDLETERYVLQAQEYEGSFLHTARIYIDLARDLGDYEVTAESKRFTETINWSDIDLEDNEFVLQMFPTSMMPQTPVGQLAYVRELMQDGFIDQNFALSLLQFPDIEGYAAMKTAPLDDIMYTLDQVLYHGNFITPEPFQNLELGLSVFQNAYLRARKDKAPEDRLELMRRWITVAQSLLDQSKQLAQQAQQQVAIPAGEQLRAHGQLPNPQGGLAQGVANPLVPQTGAPMPG
jgi:hypothetical protein